MNRRQFNQTLTLLTGALTTSTFAGIRASHKLLQLGATQAEFSRDMFNTRIGSTFQLLDEPQSLVLKGIEDADYSGPCEQFHLVFEVDSTARLEEGVRTLVSQDGFCMNLFLTPTGRGTTRQQLVSCFNLLPAV